MSRIAIGSVDLGDIPRVVAIVDRITPINEISGLIKKGADILEIRVDLFPSDMDEIEGLLKDIRKNMDIPLIGTIRETEANRSNRLSLFKRINSLVDAVDIEIDADIAGDVISLFSNKTVIVSEHDFDKTPEKDSLAGIVDKAVQFGADIIKIAAMANSRDDVIRLLSFTKERKENLVTIAMGDFGRISRVMSPLFGSLFSYAFSGTSVAPGQLSLEELVREFKIFYPEISHET